MKRYLRKEIEITLDIITMLLTLFLIMIDDFEFWFLPYLLCLYAIDIFNIWLLSTYGRGFLFKDNFKVIKENNYEK